MADRRARTVLAEEHMILGANFNENESVARYALEGTDLTQEAVTLTDLSYMDALLFAGPVAPDYIHAAFAGPDLAVGTCSYQAVLTGDGSISSVVALLRTGDYEYVALDGSPRAEILSAWLSFLAATEVDGYAPFAGLQAEDVTESHVILILRGEGAPEVLKDYLGKQSLPEKGTVCAPRLDEIPCVVAALPHEVPTYLILVPPAYGRILWRSFLSFPQVTPTGCDKLARLVEREQPWATWVEETDVIRKTAAELKGLHLVRDTTDFVGGRSLKGDA
jgi:aminomethyltransferase